MIRERMGRHGLADRPAGTVAEAVAWTGALQAQDAAAARLGVRARSGTVTEADVESAISARTIARTWLLRNTIHLVAAADLPWLAALLGPMIRRRFETVRWPQLGLPPAVLERAAEAAPEILAAGPLDRRAFAAALAERGIGIDPSGQAPVHVLVYLATHGLVCHADGDRFALVDRWLTGAPKGPRGDAALAKLARRYFRAYSPATGADFTAWSGLPSRAAIGLIRDDLAEIDVAGRPGYRLGPPQDGDGVRLLGAFDNYLIGYRDRTALIADDDRGEIYIGGIVRPSVIVDGAVVGRWRLVKRAKQATVEVHLFRRLAHGARAALEAEAADIGRFLGRDAQLRV
jgi:winged helix DNA-binding protein